MLLSRSCQGPRYLAPAAASLLRLEVSQPSFALSELNSISSIFILAELALTDSTIPKSPSSPSTYEVLLAIRRTRVSSSMSYFRITLIRSAIGLPAKSGNVLKALGLRKRMATVFHPVTPSIAGQIMKVKELVAVSEVDGPKTKQEVHQERVPDPGFYIESRASHLSS